MKEKVETNQNIIAMWPEDRRMELVELRDMLWESQGLNNGSNFMNKLDRAIKVADRLTRTNLGTGRDSFCSFLEKEAYKKSSS